MVCQLIFVLIFFFGISGAVLFQGFGSLSELYQYFLQLDIKFLFVDTNVIYQVKRSMFTKLYLFYVQIVNASQPGKCVHSEKKRDFE